LVRTRSAVQSRSWAYTEKPGWAVHHLRATEKSWTSD